MANNQGVEILTPIGKLVQGSVFELQDRLGDDGKPKLGDDGQPLKQCYFAVAIEKNNPEWPAFWNALVQSAASGYPQYFNNGNVPDLRSFAWKVTDGDGFDKYGKPNSSKPGFAGCWIVKFSSSFLPRCFEKGKYAAIQQLQDPRSIKPGYFIRVSAIARPNIGSKTHGLYLNSDMVELNFVGEEIVFGRDAGEAFGATQAGYVPAGAMALGSAVPAANAGMPGNGMSVQPSAMSMNSAASPAMAPAPQPTVGSANPGMPMGNATPAVAGNAAMTPGVPAGNVAQPHGMPGTAVQPNTGFVEGAMAAVNGVPAPAPMPTPAAQLVPTPKANGYTLEQFLANGFTYDTVVSEGYFVRAA